MRTMRYGVYAIAAVVATVLLVASPGMAGRSRVAPPRQARRATGDARASEECAHLRGEAPVSYGALSACAARLEGRRIEGHQFTQQRAYFAWAAQRPNTSTICEIGFNAGHSAYTWLRAAGPRLRRLVHFDLGEHAYVAPHHESLRAAFPGVEMELVLGSSVETVPAFAAARPEVRCDLLAVDGGHFGEVPLADLQNMRALAAPGAWVLMDDINAACPGGFCAAPTAAWRRMEAQGQLVTIQCENYLQHAPRKPLRGWCVGRYTHVAPSTTQKVTQVIQYLED